MIFKWGAGGGVIGGKLPWGSVEEGGGGQRGKIALGVC